MKNIIQHRYSIAKKDRNEQNKHTSFAIWFTGLSGSGKSTIANYLERSLFEVGIRVYSLDGDNIRSGLTRDLTFSEEDRRENNRRIAEVAKLFVDAGVVTISAFISPLKEDRRIARKIIGEENFLEIFVNTPLAICEKRDVKDLYRRARDGEIEKFTGINSPYEAPEDPFLEIETEKETVEQSVQRIFSHIEEKLKIR